MTCHRPGRAVALAGLLLCATAGAEEPRQAALMQAQQAARPARPVPLEPRHSTPCVNGLAGGTYPCSNVDLLSFTPLSAFGSSSTNSLWGWTDPASQVEYALVGADDGLAMFSLADPTHPHYLGKLPTHTGSSIWRDVRVYANHAFVVSDNNGAHGLQVFDLTRLRGVSTPQTFNDDAYRGDFGRGHTIAINESSGYAYVAGSDTCGAPAPTTGALRIYDIRTPDNPQFVSCVSTGGYTHESQCFDYHGPDTAHTGKEICLNANGPSKRLAVVDVSNKAAPVTLSSLAYTGAAYPHQAWFSADQRYALLNDELDESQFGHNARTLVFDLADLDAPVLVGHYQHSLGVIDHNLYVHGQYVYESNYEAGLRILRIDNLSQAKLTEVAYFDSYPDSNSAAFNGNWNNYRFPGSGNVIMTGIDEGFFVVQPKLCAASAAPTGLSAVPAGDRRIDLLWSGSGTAGARWRVERAQGGCGGVFETLAEDLASSSFSDTQASGLVDYGYRIVEQSADGQCASPASACVQAQTGGDCSAPPLFSGVTEVTNTGSATCQLKLGWSTAAPACGGPASYSIYRGDSADFLPAAANRIASGLGSSSYLDSSIAGGAPRYYVVRAVDGANASEDGNRVVLGAAASGPLANGTFAAGAEPGEPPFDTLVSGGTESVAGPRHAGWHTSTSQVHGGTQSYWSTSANNLCVTLVSQSLQLTAGQSSTLSFWHYRDIQAGRDGGVVEISTDGGVSWTRLAPAGGYPSSITGGGTLCGISQGSGVYSGTSGWAQASVNLAAYAGRSVQLRWMYRTDAATAGQGWFVDDIAVTQAQVPGSCAPGVDGIFADGFQ